MKKEIDLQKLKKSLPRGYASTLQKIIKKKHNKEYHLQSIRRGLTDRSPSDLIIKEAVLLAESIEKSKSELAEKVQSLK